jgi:hypothetical protein
MRTASTVSGGGRNRPNANRRRSGRLTLRACRRLTSRNQVSNYVTARNVAKISLTSKSAAISHAASKSAGRNDAGRNDAARNDAVNKGEQGHCGHLRRRLQTEVVSYGSLDRGVTCTDTRR